MPQISATRLAAAVAAFAAAAAVAYPRASLAQSGQEGIFLLLPVGARD